MSDSQRILPSLPLELIFRVFECLAPTTAVALRPNDPRAQTIRSSLLVCHAIYPVALRLLYTHCLYIDSSDRLRQLLISLNHHTSSDTLTEYEEQSVDQDYSSTTLSRLKSLPQINVRSYLRNLYLSPFEPTTIDDLPTAQWVHELLCLSRDTLRRFILAIPLDTLPAYRDRLDVRVWLRRGITSLTAIEEFVCLCDELDIASYAETWADPITPDDSVPPKPRLPIWTQWKNLRRLSVRESSARSGGYQHLHLCTQLESVIVSPRSWQPQKDWKWFFAQVTEQRSRDVKVIWPAAVRVAQRQTRDFRDGLDEREFFLQRLSWARLWNLDDRQTSRVKYQAIVVNPDEHAADTRNRVSAPLQTWLRDRAVEGTIWDLEMDDRFRNCGFDPALWFDKDFDDSYWPQVDY